MIVANIRCQLNAACANEYSHSLEHRLAAFLLAVVMLFSPSGILANRDAYLVGLFAKALPLMLVAAYTVACGADRAMHPASPGFARTLG